MSLSSKAAYLKGLSEGLNLDKDKKDAKVLNGIVDLLVDIANEVDELNLNSNDTYERIEILDKAIGLIAEDLYENFSDFEREKNSDCDEEFTVECSKCKNPILITNADFERGFITCSQCGKEITLLLSDDEDTEE